MADDDKRCANSGEFGFKPLDCRQIEMVGRLVKKQNVGSRREDLGQRASAQFATRQSRGILAAGQADAFE